LGSGHSGLSSGRADAGWRIPWLFGCIPSHTEPNRIEPEEQKEVEAVEAAKPNPTTTQLR